MSTSPTPLSPSYPRLLFIEIHGGYLDGLRVLFALHSTCIIGGKGSGKTTLFELIRFCLGGTSLAPKSTVPGLLKRNLAGGEVRVGFETRHGVRYVAARKISEARPRYTTPDGAPATVAPDLFGVEAYGQDEIENVGSDRASQLGLVDRLAGEALRPILVEIDDLGSRLADNGRALLALEAEIAALESDASEARAIDEQLRPLVEASGPDGALLQKAHAAKGLRGRERQAMLAATASVGDVKSGVDALVVTLRKKLATALPREAREGGNAELFAAVELELAGVAGALEALATSVTKRAEAASAVLASHTARLAEDHAKQDALYDALQSRQKEDQARTDERARLQERHAVVAGAVTALEERLRVHGDLRRDRAQLAKRLVELRDLRHAQRKRVEERVCAELEPLGVQVLVHQDTQTESLRAILREAFTEMTNGQPKWLVDRIARLRPDEIVALVRAQDKAGLVAAADLKRTPDRAKDVIAALTPNARLYAIEAAAIDDEAIIKVKHGEHWKDTVECSPGQRAGGILPILLLEGDWPLLVDQPDDNVEPDFLCGVILPRIAALKGARQFVFVTHHANLPVISAAEQVAYITSDGARAGVHAEGDYEKMTPWIVSKLEGGKAAFEARRRAYAKKKLEGDGEDEE